MACPLDKTKLTQAPEQIECIQILAEQKPLKNAVCPLYSVHYWKCFRESNRRARGQNTVFLFGWNTPTKCQQEKKESTRHIAIE